MRPEKLEGKAREISKEKDEPNWMLRKRLEAIEALKEMQPPEWGPDLSELSLEDYKAFEGTQERSSDWDDVPGDVKQRFEELGIPEAERKALAGAGAQLDSEVVYQDLKEQWEDEGVVFLDMDEAVQRHPEQVREHFMEIVPAEDNFAAALHGALWSGGSFVHVPQGVEVEIPVQAYFLMESRAIGQFEHTLIIAEPGSDVHYIEGCSAPQYTESNLHAGCVEIAVREDAEVQFSTVQNWSQNTYNLNTKRAVVEKNGRMEWVSGSIGSKTTMLYPSTHLTGEKASAKNTSIAYGSGDQNLDTGAKMVHEAPNTSSTVESKSLVDDEARTNYRGLLRIEEEAENSKASVECDALMFSNDSTSDTEPFIEVENSSSEIAHEATTGRIGEEEIHYMETRGLEEEKAKELIVRGFMDPITRELPLQYAVELNRLIELEMEDSVG